MTDDMAPGCGREGGALAGADGDRHDAVAARLAVVSYLATFGDDPEHTARLAEALTARALRRCRLRPELDVSATALEEAERDLLAWSLFVLGPDRVDEHSAALVACAAYQACGRATRWPGALLRYDLPDGFVEAMRSAAPPPTPEERPGRMVAQPLETWSPVELPGLWHRLLGALAGTSRG